MQPQTFSYGIGKSIYEDCEVTVGSGARTKGK